MKRKYDYTISTTMSSTDQLYMPCNFDNGWGFYVDLENSQSIQVEPRECAVPRNCHCGNKYNNYDGYDGYDGYDEYYNIYIPDSNGLEKKMGDSLGLLITRISSAAIISTIAITYVVLCVL